MSAAQTSVLVVGLHRLTLGALEQLLSESGFRVVGRARSGEEALRLLAEQPVDVVVVDLQMPTGDVLSWLRQVREEHSETVVVVISEPTEQEEVETVLQEGATAYVLKTADPKDLVTAVRQALRPSVFFPKHADRVPSAKDAAPFELTERELEILRLVASGKSNAQVAQKLRITEPTVKSHLSNVYRKLGVANRTQAARVAQTHGLLAAKNRSLRR